MARKSVNFEYISETLIAVSFNALKRHKFEFDASLAFYPAN